MWAVDQSWSQPPGWCLALPRAERVSLIAHWCVMTGHDAGS